MALREERTYNVLGQMLTQAVRKGGTDLKWRITNEYGLSGNNGNLTKQWTETGTATYGVRYAYDGANRIRGAAENAPGEANLASQTCAAVGGTWCVKYAINGFGNAWTENKSETAGGLTPLAETSFEAFTNRLLGASYYANGFQKSLVLNDNKSRAEYDADGRLRKAGRVTEANGTVWDVSQLLTENTYNGAGQRVKRTVTQGPATSTTHYVYGLDGEVASEWESGPTTVTGRQFLVGDQLGSTRVRFDANGEVLQRIDYEPYGGEVQRTGVSGYSGGNEVKQKFTGKERDQETGLDYFGARYMAAAMGRFSSPDGLFMSPTRLLDPAGLNLYGYVRNRPTIAIDRDGLATIVVTVGANQSARVSVYSDSGVLRGRFNGLARGVGGRDRMASRNDTPLGKYLIRGSQHGRDISPSFGTAKVALDPVAGEIRTSGRSLIRIHGGGGRLARPFDPRQPLVATEGCIRVANADGEFISAMLQEMKFGDNDYLYVGDPDSLQTMSMNNQDLRSLLDKEKGTYFDQQVGAGFERLLMQLWLRRPQEESRGSASSALCTELGCQP